MSTLRIVNDSPDLSATELHQLGSMVSTVLPAFLAAYGKPPVRVEVSNVAGPTGTMNFYLTERNRMSGDYGWHGTENGSPAGWISPRACGITDNQPLAVHNTVVFGVFIPALPPVVSEGKTLFAGSPAVAYPRIASVLLHEIFEALIDQNPDAAISTPETFPQEWAKDPDGNYWLKEVSDQANSGHFVAMISTRVRRGLKIVTLRQPMVLADAALPSFYDVNGKTPFSLAQLLATRKPSWLLAALPAAITKPFDHVPGCYAYIRGANGADMSMFARKDD